MSKASTAHDLQEEREQIARQFEIEAIRLGYAVEQRLPKFRYRVLDTVNGRRYRAIVLPTSFDFHEYRLNSGKTRFDLLIVSKHTAAVPIHVVSLTQVTTYEPLSVPTLEDKGRRRRTREEMHLLVSKLLLNFEGAWEELEQMSRRHRDRFLRMRDEYLKPRVGRPWAS